MTTGFSQQTLEAISSGEPAWLTAQRLTAWQAFEKLPLPTRRDLDWQRFDIRSLNLNKVALQLDKPSITERLTPLPADLASKGVIFCDMGTAIAKHGDLVKEYLGKNIAPDEPRKFNALHMALWKTGTFLYVPRNVKINFPLEILYTFSGQNVAGFPHTLVVIEPGAEATLVQKFVGGPPAGTNGAPSIHASG